MCANELFPQDRHAAELSESIEHDFRWDAISRFEL